ncbi:hypothetical protein HL667_10265 [Bradyrhizobium sp. 83012]|uniref:HEPN domain-containing protein n=1 Tax=Bradyrhizobium aeschynomenes TaxID=2734909 RepID=A0ABX2CDL7_9BRAD|nr:hypothetical protein [Bradyrhizobium aeschynomenes]NPU65379.1 hypothetical protein [Bradyrhizobium aeschynomenes]
MPTKTLYLNGKLVCEYDAPADQQAEIELCRKLLEDRGLWKPISSERTIFNQAVAFANASAIIYERDLSTTPVKNGNSAVPFIVNSSFATELYLKAICLLNGNVVRGHQLDKLFGIIPAAGLARIEQKLHTLAPNNAWRSGILTPADLLELFRRHRDAFVRWRYVHEQAQLEQFHFRDAIFAMQVLHETCCEYPQIGSA